MSEQPSDTSTQLPLRDERPTLLLDENLSSADIAAFLRPIKAWQIEIHTDYLARGLPDPDVIRECGARRWVLVSCDDRIRRVPENKAAIIRYQVPAFMFAKGNYQGVEYAAALIVGRRHIFDTLKKNSGHFFARIQIGGDVAMLEPQTAQAAALTSRQKTKRKYGQKIQET